MLTAKYLLAMWPASLFAPFLLTHDADECEAYDKSEGKHTFADLPLLFVRREVNKYLIDSYINSSCITFSLLWAAEYLFRQTLFVQTYALFEPTQED